MHRGRIAVHPPAPPAIDVLWCGEDELRVLHGRVAFRRAAGEGIAQARLETGALRVRPRIGGERLELAGRPRRALSAILQEAGPPPWERRALPLVHCGGALAAVPGIGVDAAFAATAGGPGIAVSWHPAVI